MQLGDREIVALIGVLLSSPKLIQFASRADALALRSLLAKFEAKLVELDFPLDSLDAVSVMTARNLLPDLMLPEAPQNGVDPEVQALIDAPKKSPVQWSAFDKVVYDFAAGKILVPLTNKVRLHLGLPPWNPDNQEKDSATPPVSLQQDYEGVE